MVRVGDEKCCAKLYKEATERSFLQAVVYSENRKIKNSLGVPCQLASAAVQVSKPCNFCDGILVVEVMWMLRRNFFGQFAPDLLASRFGEEIWALYEGGVLSPDTPLTGRFTRQSGAVDVGGVLREIDDARAEETARRVRMGV